MNVNDTKTMILDVAQELLETRGFNAFSIKDLAERVSIRTSSIHYHFPTKADLCRALIARHRHAVAQALGEINRQHDGAFARLECFISLFQTTIDAGNRMCPFGMLASDSHTLDTGSCSELRAAFDDLENWLIAVLEEGQKAGSVHLEGTAALEARCILATLEGAMLVARTYGDQARFSAVARQALLKLVHRKNEHARFSKAPKKGP
jgi:TetR/AcrR family transcriptional repressor of nem operon